MLYLLAGLVIFLGAHSVRIFAEDWRTARIASMGPNAWKGAYTVVSLAGFALLCYGYGQTRLAPVVDLWMPPPWTRHLAALVILPGFILLAAAYVPGTHMKAKLGHPMIAGTKAWAIGHLLSNGRLGDVVLFGAILAWAVLDFRASRQRDRAQGKTYPAVGASRDLVAVVAGLVAYAAFALWAHGPLIGVRPFG